MGVRDLYVTGKGKQLPKIAQYTFMVTPSPYIRQNIHPNDPHMQWCMGVLFNLFLLIFDQFADTSGVAKRGWGLNPHSLAAGNKIIVMSLRAF